MRNSRSKRAAAMILLIIMTAAIFAGCGGEKKSGDIQNLSTESVPPETQETVYVPEYISLPEGYLETDYICSYDDRFFFSAYLEVKGEGDDVTYVSMLCAMNTDGTGFAELGEFELTDIPEGMLGNAYISSLCVDNEGYLWITEYMFLYHLDEKGYYVDDGRQLYLRKLSRDGAELLRADITELMEENPNFYVGAMTIDSSGRIYMTNDDKRVFVLDNEGKLLFTLDSANWINAVITLSDGTAAGMTYDNGLKVKRIDVASQTWGENYPLLISAISAYSGNEASVLYYTDASSMFSYDSDKKEFTEMVNWMDLNINGENISYLTVLPDGTISCVINNYNGETWFSEIIIVSKKPVSEVPVKTILQMACFGLESDMRAAVIDFNKRNDQYRVEVTDYSEYNTSDSDSAGLIKLNTELISGNMPDLLCTSRLAVKQYAAKGLFEDLYPFIDSDTELGGREALMKEVFKAFEMNGSLYEITPGFGISTVMGKSDIVGTESGWDIDGLIALLERQPEGTQAFPNMNAEGIINLLAMVMHEYVDWETGICAYDSESFIEILDFAMRFPAEQTAYSEADTVLLREGRALLLATHMTTFEEIQLYKGMFDGEITFTGYPTGSGNGSAFTMGAGLAMTTACKDKEGAWEFMRNILSEDYQSEYVVSYFPTNKAVFDKRVEEAMDKNMYTDANGTETELSKGTWSWDGSMSFNIFASTPEEIEQIMQLISTTEDNLSYDETLLTIIQEEAKILVAGQTSVRETAALIQQRVSTYINEQK